MIIATPESPTDRGGALPSTSPLVEHWDETRIAKHLGISRRHLSHLRDRRLIRFVKLGRLVRFNPVQVAQDLEALTVRPKVRL